MSLRMEIAILSRRFGGEEVLEGVEEVILPVPVKATDSLPEDI